MTALIQAAVAVAVLAGVFALVLFDAWLEERRNPFANRTRAATRVLSHDDRRRLHRRSTTGR